MFLSMKQASRQASRQAFKPRGCVFKDEASLEAGFKAGLEAGLEAGFQGLKDIFSMKQALRFSKMQATKTNPRQKSRESVAHRKNRCEVEQACETKQLRKTYLYRDVCTWKSKCKKKYALHNIVYTDVAVDLFQCCQLLRSFEMRWTCSCDIAMGR